MSPWGIAPSVLSSTTCGFVCPSALLAMTPMHRASSSSSSTLTSKLHSAEKNYSAEWIDLLSKDSYESSSIPLPGQIDPPRSGAVSFSTPNNDKLFTFAGYAEVAASSGDGLPERYVVNDLWQFVPHQEADTNSSWGWTKIIQDKDGYIPGPRLATAMPVHPSTNKAVLLGGWDPQTAGTGGIILDDVSLLDLESLEWSPCIYDIASNNNEVTIPGGPTSRHVAVTLALECPDEEKELQHVICLHNHRCDDHVLLLRMDKDGEGQWENQPVTGNVPSSRGLHCAATLTHDDNTSKAVVIFGGAAKDGDMKNEAHALDVKTWKWTKLDCGNDPDVPSPRAGACLALLDEDSVLLFGGATPAPGGGGLLGLNDVWVLHVDLDNGTGKWECLVRNQSNGDERNDDIIPPGRNAAILSPIAKSWPNDLVWKQQHGQKSYYFLLQGGWYPFRQTYSDNFLLKVTSN